MTKKLSFYVWCLLLFGAFISCSEGKTEQKTGPNFIFFITDDMYPYMFNNLLDTNAIRNLTPTLDTLIAEGVWLKNMKVISPVCTPSRYNCLTGNYASRASNEAMLNTRLINGGQTVIQWNSLITPGEEKTMGHYFQEIGYRTGFVGKNHIIESIASDTVRPNLDADPRNPEIKKGLVFRDSILKEHVKNSGFDYADGLYHNNPDWLGIRELAVHNMDWVTEKALDFLNENPDNPFMLYMATTLQHGPIRGDRAWKADRRVTPIGILEKSPEVLPSVKGPISNVYDSIIASDPGREASIRNFISINRRIVKDSMRGQQKENLLWMDDALGALLQKLDTIGQLDNTIIVFFNDHGQNQKGTLYEGGINAEAFIWKKGGFKVGNVLETPVTNVDFLPTLLSLAGKTDVEDHFDGSSFKEALEGDKYRGKPYSYHELGYTRAIVKDGFKYYTVRYPEWATNLDYEGRKKLLEEYNAYKAKHGRPIMTTDPNAPFGQLVMVPGGESAEQPSYHSMPHFHDPDQLYDLTNDPGETRNLINDPAYAKKIEELRSYLQKELSTLPGNYPL